MFGLFRRRKSDPSSALLQQAIGGQSVLYRIFRESLDCKDSHIRRIELTYFAATMVTMAYLAVSKAPFDVKQRVSDQFTNYMLHACISQCGEDLTINTAIKEYQDRYKEYYGLILPLLSPETTDTSSPITLSMHLFQCVTKSSAREKMVIISLASTLIVQYISDNIEFVKDEKL